LSQAELAPASAERLAIHNLVKRDPLADLAEDVRRGLSSNPKRLFPKYLYDELGSQLFEAICLLPEYYPTRAENEILTRYADEIVSLTGQPNTLIEMGSGSASKTRLIIEALLRLHEPLPGRADLLFIPVDISASALESSSRILLQSYPRLRVEAYAAEYFNGLETLSHIPRGRTLALFLGSNISNFEPDEAGAFLLAMRAMLRAMRCCWRRFEEGPRCAGIRLQRCPRGDRSFQPQHPGAHQPGVRRQFRSPQLSSSSLLQ
jgi:uncharacterized SAM-dependent methyltransferase